MTGISPGHIQHEWTLYIQNLRKEVMFADNVVQ